MRKKLYIGIIIFVTISAFLFQKTKYERKIISQDDRIIQYEKEISDLSIFHEKLSKEVEAKNWDITVLEDKNEELIKDENLEARFEDLKYHLVLNNLSYYWNYIWEDIYTSGEIISDSQIEEINFLLQPTFNYENTFVVNPLSGYFASYYDDIKDIDLGKFLRYSPIGIVPDELPEIKMLSKHANWPFDGEDNINKLPVPIHRYERDLVQNLFSTYAGINLDELTETDFHDLIYLESTAAYYNYTSDFGPASFRCKTAVVEGNIIRLYGDRKSDAVLTIIKIGNKYFIKSLIVRN